MSRLKNETKQAREHLAEARDLAPEYSSVPLVAAFVAMRGGSFDEAIEILRSSVESQPGSLHVRGNLGLLYAHLGRFREAESVFAS